MKEHKKDRDILCARRLDQTKLIKTAPWTMEEPKEVLKGLKQKKSRDPNSFLMNRIRSDQVYPKCMELCNITSLYNSELVKRVNSAQIENPSKGDWCHTVQMDMELISLIMTNCEIISMSKN